MLEQLQKQEEKQREQEQKLKEERKLAREDLLKEYKQIKEEQLKSEEEKKKELRRKFFKGIFKKKLRLKSELKSLRKTQRDGLPKYDLRGVDIGRPNIRLGKIREEVNSTTPKTKFNHARTTKNSVTRYGKGHIEALCHLETTISAMGIYKNHLPSPKRYY
jgi:dsDNA-specific endonuclease/ATPase MutS2